MAPSGEKGSSASAYAPLADIGSVDSRRRTVRLDTLAARPSGTGGPAGQLDGPTEPARPREQVKGSVPSDSGGPTGRGVAEEDLATSADGTLHGSDTECRPTDADATARHGR